MVKDYFDESNYEDFQISDSEIASAVFRDYLSTRTSKFKQVNIMDYYKKLSNKKQKIIWHIISHLLPEKKREQNLKGYFQELIEYREIKREQISKMIYAKYNCDYVHGKEPLEPDFENMKSKIKSFTNVINPHNDSYLLNDICTLLNVDLDTITTGYGKEYLIDNMKLKQHIEENGYNVDEYLQNFVSEYIPCDKCTNKKKCSVIDSYCKYLMHDIKSITHALSEKLVIDINEILIERNIVIDTDNLSFEDYYKRLSKYDKEIVSILIRDLFALDDCNENIE